MSSSEVDFVHLHNHTEYSLLDGVTPLTEGKDKPSPILCELARQGAKGLAITDHGNMYGAVEFYLRCRKAGIKPIIGCEFYMAKGRRTERGGSQKDNGHLTVLSRNAEGYENLMSLSTKAFLEGFYYDPRIDKELLFEHSKGLVVLSGCLKGELAQTLLRGDVPSAVRLAGEMRDRLDKDCFFLEIMDHGLPEQRQALKGILEVHEKTGIPLVATNDCHYPLKSDAAAHDARVCISTGRQIADTNRLRFESHEFYYKGVQEMAKTFHFAPESLANTVRIADMCSLEIDTKTMHLPDFPIPTGFTQDSYLEKLCREGLSRLGVSGREDYEKRLSYELSVIKRMGFSGYFLIVWDFIRYAKQNGIPVGPGRGSGAGSLVSYSLDITTIDPIQHRLLFERFLNPDRKSMPDLDIDFSDTGRTKVIEYVRNKYGATNVAQIITFGSMGAKAVIRDVGRVLGVPLPEVDRIAKMIPSAPGMTLAKALESNPDFAAASQEPQTRKLLELAKRLEGLKRHTGVHAAGIVITKEHVWKYSPLARGSSEVVTTQYDGDILPMLGLLKMDFLGLRNLSVIAGAVELIRGRKGPSFDIAKIPMNDVKTYELLASGRALGVFQLDSEGMRELLRRLKPTTFEDISAVIALYRPGPMQSGMLDLFVERKHGKTKIRHDHPKLADLLQDTYGCIVYQEQVMEIAKALAGFTPGEADGLRKAMGKKIAEEMDKLRGKFVDGCKAGGVAEKIAQKIYDQIEKFGGYGFNKSHTVAYGTVSYQTAYLKTNFPLEYFTSLLTSEIGHSAVDAEGKENKLVTYLEDAKAFGIRILNTDVQRSLGPFSIEDDAIRFGLLAVKNVGSGAAESLIAARKDGPFRSLDDLCRRVDLHSANRKTLESLIKAGAMDSFFPGMPAGAARSRMMAELDETMSRQNRIKEDLAKGQGLLFGSETSAAAADAPKTASQAAEPWHEHDLLKNEKEVLGFFLSGHPLMRYKGVLSCVATHRISELSPSTPQPVRLAGYISSVRKLTTKKNELMARVQLEDLTGEIPLIVFPKTYAQISQRIKTDSIVVVSGELQYNANLKDEDQEARPELRVRDILPIDEAVSHYARRLTLRFSTTGLEETFVEELRRILRKYPGSIPVRLKLETPAHGEHWVETEDTVALDMRLFPDLERLLGDKAWKIESGS
ncbi:MAG: DNA polymerase III subunit alpha [Elusimicrobiota bacterium]|jgi:DNA polymerase-3 subunit alpha